MLVIIWLSGVTIGVIVQIIGTYYLYDKLAECVNKINNNFTQVEDKLNEHTDKLKELEDRISKIEELERCSR